MSRLASPKKVQSCTAKSRAGVNLIVVGITYSNIRLLGKRKSKWGKSLCGRGVSVWWYFKFMCSFPYVLSRCCLSCLHLRSYFVNVIERGAHGCKNFRISSSWAIYRIKHMVYVSLQIHLCSVPSCEENLVEDWIKFGSQVKLRLFLRNFRAHHRQWKSDYFVVDVACCDAHPPPHLRNPNLM